MAEKLQIPKVRNEFYKRFQLQETRDRSWYTCKRADGIVGFLFPSGYHRGSNLYPRLTPKGKGISRLGVLGVERRFRQGILGDLSERFSLEGYRLVEVDLESCHTQILVELGIGADGIKELLGSGKNLWKSIVAKLDPQLEEKFGFNFLKACAKKLCYKALQGGRIDTVKKIHNTLKENEAQVADNLLDLSASFYENELLREFDLLNKEIMRRFHQRFGQLRVYTPIDTVPFTLVKQGSAQEKYDGYTSNPCRVAAQIVTGVEMMQIILLLEGMKKLHLNWLPVSLHHDGCALLIEDTSFDQGKLELEKYLRQRLESSGMQIKGLEFSPYVPIAIQREGQNLRSPTVEKTEIKDNRIV